MYYKEWALSRERLQGKPRSVEDFAQIKAEFLLEVEQVITMDEIPPELIINFDQTGLNVL